ncbi:chromosome segregation ATPase family protein [Hirsutella rhossiliensis]|uniref:Chromosome segregation ATPase family protein n=1 Tax=Hirsutella rhossiliensis TaxID=111463 RepID=A0A9P8N5E9_9HYPO|nr:chromosome segregation ATPase family protein [Hirsutella rhossiliensis]KAH0966937.1 chromosome segregation ATPase family protein [Hirsutella rhossiliensis]
MPQSERDSPPEGERRLRHQHSASSDHGSRALVPMWDSSDPDRAPPPLPLNPQSPSFSSRAGTSSAIQSAHAALGERARESAALVPALARRMNDGSPEKALVKGSHRRMQSLQPGSVRDLSLMLEGPRILPQTPGRPGDRQDRPSTPTQGYPGFESRSNEHCTDGPPSMPGPSLTPIVRPTVRRPATTQSILGENTPPQSSTMLALQAMGARPRSQDGEPALSNITNGASVGKGPHSLEGLSAQILSLTSIAQSLKKDLTQLSRRSKDNATDLLSLKEATSTRDEDIRRGLRDLMGNMSEASSRITSREHFAGLFIDNKPHCTSPSNGRPFQVPRIPSPRSFADSIDGASVSTPSLSGAAEGAASIALLDKILRGLGTKEGNESLLDLLKELAEKVSGMATADKIDELAELVREQSESAIVPDVSVRYKSLGDQGSLGLSDNGALTQRMERLLNSGESRRSSAPPGRGAELLNEDLIQIIRSVKDSVAQGGGLTAEVKALVRELRGEVLGMGRELGKRLEKMGDKAIEESEAPSKDEVSRVIDEGLEQMKEQLNHVLREHRRQSQASASSQKTLVDYQEIYNAMRAALRDNEASRGEMPDLSREDVIEAVRDAWENYKPEIEVQHLGLEREEVLTCLKEGLQEYMPRDEKPAGATREEVFKAVVEGLKHFVPPQMDTTATISRDEIIEAVRDCLEEFEFPVSASAVGHDMTHSDMVHAVKEGLEGLDLPRGDALVAHSNNDEVLTRLHDIMDYLKAEFKAVSEEAKENVAANGRDTEQVLDATNDGLESLRAALESYVDRATGASGQEEFMESLARSMDEFKEELTELVSQTQVRDGPHNERDTEQILDATKDGLESLRVAIEGYVDRATGASGQEELMESLVRSMDEFKEDITELVSQTQAQDGSHDERDTEQILDATKDGLENLRVAIEGYVDRAAGASGQDEIIESICRSMEELKEELAHVVSEANESSREQLQTELEGLREIVNSSMVPASPQTPNNNQEVLEALHSGLNSLRQEILRPRPETSEILDALQEGLNELRVGIDKVTNKPVDLTANDEIMDALRSGLDSVRADIEALRDSSNDKTVAAVTALSNEAPDNAIIPADMIKQDDIKNLEVLITQLRIKVEAMEPQRETESLHQEDLARLEDMLRDVQERVNDISSRAPPAPVEEEEARDAPPAANGDAATKEDVEAIETILRNTKALLDDLIDGEQAVRKEHLDVVESLALETRETLGSVSDQLGGVCQKEDLAELETLLGQVGARLDETKELAEKDAANDDKATKTDIEAVETVVLEMKTMLDGLAVADFASFSNKEDIAGLETAVKEAAEKLETHVESSSKAFDDRQAEIVGVADRVTDVKAFLEEFQETVKGRLEEGSTGLEALNKLLEGMSETVAKNENVGTDLKEMLDTMKTQFDESKEVVAGARLESNEKLQEATENIGTKIDDKMAELITKYDEFKAAMDERNAAGEARDIETEAAVVGTKAVAEEVKLLIDTLGSTVTDSLEKMEEASKTVFAQVEELASRAEENHTDGKTEHQQTRDQIQQTVTAVEELQGEVKEFHPQILEAVKDLLLLVGEHFEHSKASTTELQDKIVESKPPEQPALPPPEKYDDSEVREKLDRLTELKYDDTGVRETLGRLIEDKYDDSQVLEKLEKLAEQSDSAAEALARLEALDQVHQSVSKTAADLSQFLSNQTQRIADDHEDRERTLQETTAMLERKLAEKEHLEVSVSSLRDEEERLRRSVVSLRTEQESLIRQKTRLTGDVSSLETAMRLRKEALSDMEYRADRLERRIMEGVMDHSRVLLMAKSSKEGDKMSRKRTKKSPAQQAEACKARPAVNIALSAKRNLAPAAQNGAARRIASLSQMNNNAPSSMVKRSQSVRTPHGTALRKRSWGGGMGKGFDAEDKENVGVRETVEEVEESEAGAPPSLDGETGDDGSTTALDSTVVDDDDDGHSDAGTLRRSSMGTTVLTSSTGQYTESEAAYSEYDDGGSEYSESAVGTEAGGDNELVVYGQ